MLSFQNLNTYSHLLDENEFFRHYFNPDTRFRYDSNFFQLKFSPSVSEFELIEEMQIYFSIENQLSHIKFYWPDNLGIRPDTLEYLSHQDYKLEKLELLKISPESFLSKSTPSAITVVEVAADLMDTLKTINYIEDLTISEEYATSKGPFYDDLFADQTVVFYMAFYDNEPAGSCIVSESRQAIEIDDLFTVKEFRQKGVATALQQKVMAWAKNQKKPVILATDSEGSPITMYKRQGYESISFRIGAHKEIEEDTL
ncbi:hypothetical protein GCM10008932_02390 [Alkalibacterium iburiense]|uniref:N-acetyltransferase domain-containing protein n=1 Tax=Alkalibacterium iburiense TaxID=290589 RepID=A0ABN0X1M2_9LACT